MKPTYELIEIGNFQPMVKRTDEDGKVWHIPTNPANSDYQRYLRYLENPDAEEGGTL